MRQAVLIILLFCLQAKAWPQQMTKSYLTGSIGPSIPFSEFKETNFNYDGSGYALSGICFAFQGVYFFDSFVGIGVDAGTTINPLNLDKYGDYIKSTDPTIVDLSIYTSTPYVNVYVAAGLYFNFPIGKKFHVTPKVLGGVLVTTTTTIEADVYFDNGDYAIGYTESATASTFLPVYGCDIRYSIDEDFLVLLSFERMEAKQKFEYPVTGGYYIEEKKISFFNASMGFGIFF